MKTRVISAFATVALVACCAGTMSAAAGRSEAHTVTTKRPVQPTARAPAEKGFGVLPLNLAEIAPQKYESVHFTLYADFQDEAYVKQLQGDLERYFSKFQKEYWDFIRPEHREAQLTLAVFANQETFDALAAADAGVPKGEKGYSSKSAGRLAFVRQPEYWQDVMIVVHELAHVFNRFSLPATPVWLDEGMAQYYANIASEACGNPNVSSGMPARAIEMVDEALKKGRFAGIQGLLGMDDDTFYGENADYNYAQSWALIFYLRKGLEGGGGRLEAYYELLAKGGSSYAAFATAFGDVGALENRWLGYLATLYAEVVEGTPTEQKSGELVKDK